MNLDTFRTRVAQSAQAAASAARQFSSLDEMAQNDDYVQSEGLNVSNKKGLVSIAARSGNPETAAAVVNAVLDAYQAHNEEARQRQYSVRERELSERDRAMAATLQSLNE